MNYMQIDKSSISNGLGVRVVLWCAGCTLCCKHCHNSYAQRFDAGKPFDENAKMFLFNQLSKSYIKGITLTGGHPVEQMNAEDVLGLIREIRAKFPSKDIWLYTGLTLSIDDFMQSYTDIIVQNEIFRLCDVIVDGPYIEEERDITLAFRGSKNQRLINVLETLKQGEIITIQNY